MQECDGDGGKNAASVCMKNVMDAVCVVHGGIVDTGRGGGPANNDMLFVVRGRIVDTRGGGSANVVISIYNA